MSQTHQFSSEFVVLKYPSHQVTSIVYGRAPEGRACGSRWLCSALNCASRRPAAVGPHNTAHLHKPRTQFNWVHSFPHCRPVDQNRRHRHERFVHRCRLAMGDDFIGNYQRVEEIGQGSFGNIWKVRRTSDGQVRLYFTVNVNSATHLSWTVSQDFCGQETKLRANVRPGAKESSRRSV